MYTAASDQFFNMDKSSMFFSPNVFQHTIGKIKTLFNLQVVSSYEQYLGLPSVVGRNKTAFFNVLKNIVLSKLNQ